MKVIVIKGLVTHSDKDYAVGKSFTCNKDDGKNLIDAGFVVEDKENKRNSSSHNKEASGSIEEQGMFTQLKAEAEALGIETESKSFEELKAEMEAE